MPSCELWGSCGLPTGGIRKRPREARGAKPLQHQGQQPRSQPQARCLFGEEIRWAAFSPGFRPPFPHELGGTVRGLPATSGQRGFPRIPDSFQRGPFLSSLLRQTLRNAPKWPARQSGTSRPLCILCACIWERGRGENAGGGKTGQLCVPLPLGPRPSGQCCQGLCGKPTCPVRTVVMATGEAGRDWSAPCHAPTPPLPCN